MSMTLNQCLVNSIVVIKILLYIGLIFLSSFFAGIETALLRYTAVKTKIKESLTNYVKIWEESPELIISSILIGTNLACIGVGVLNVSLNLWIGWSILLLLVFGEILPKLYAFSYPHKVINAGIKTLTFFSRIISPVAKALVDISVYFTSIFLKERAENPFFSKNELSEFISSDVIFDSEEKFMYSNMLELAEKRVYDVMIPKEEIVAVDINLSLEEIMNKLSNTKFSRIPVYDKNLDNIIGIIYVKDLIVALQNKELFVINDLLRKAYFVVDTARIVDVLKKFKQGQHHMAIVVNEYGATVGLVTIEDIIEEIVGEIYDEYDLIQQNIKLIDENTYIISGDENISTVEQTLGIELADEEVGTIGGYVATKVGYLPSVGEKFVFDNLEVEILDGTEKVIKKLKVKKLK